MKRSRLLTKVLLPEFLLRVLGIPRSSLYGEARWMGWHERRQFLSRHHDGLVLGPGCRLSAAESCKHLVLMGPPGSGRTTRYVIPNVLELQGSAVVIDPSGETYNATSGYLQERGFAIQVLQPDTPERSLRFNPLHSFRSDAELRRLAGILAGTLGRDEREAFWRRSVADAIGYGLQALTAQPDPATPTLAGLRQLLFGLGNDETLLKMLNSRWLRDAIPAKHREFFDNKRMVRDFYLSGAWAALSLWSDPAVARFSGDTTVDIGMLRQQPAVIYLIVPEQRVRYYSVLVNLFLTACFDYCAPDRNAAAESGVVRPVYFFLEEFGELGRIAGFASRMKTLSQRRCSLSLILPAKSQLDALYGEDADTILGSCGHQLCFGGLDPATCRSAEELHRQNRYDDTRPEDAD